MISEDRINTERTATKPLAVLAVVSVIAIALLASIQGGKAKPTIEVAQLRHYEHPAGFVSPADIDISELLVKYRELYIAVYHYGEDSYPARVAVRELGETLRKTAGDMDYVNRLVLRDRLIDEFANSGFADAYHKRQKELAAQRRQFHGYSHGGSDGYEDDEPYAGRMWLDLSPEEQRNFGDYVNRKGENNLTWDEEVIYEEYLEANDLLD